MLSFKECNGLQVIEGNRNNLAISEDYDTDPSKPYAVFLFTPDMDKLTDHHHIELTDEQAAELHDWLGKFLYAR